MAAATLVLFFAQEWLSRGPIEAKLTPKEFSLLAELADHPGKVLTHTRLLREVWGPAHTDNVEYLRVTVRSLRKKLEDDPSSPTLILNEPGIGYRLREQNVARKDSRKP